MTKMSRSNIADPGPRGPDAGGPDGSAPRGLGTPFASLALVASFALGSMNCVVLDPTSGSESPLPPTLSSPPSAWEDGVAMEQIIEVRRADDDSDTVLDSGTLAIPLVLTYGDDRPELSYRVFLDLQRENESAAISVSGGRIPGGEGSVERTFEARINYDNLGGHGCHRLTVVATTAFANPGLGALPLEGEPVARAAFFVNVLEPLAEPPLVEDCPR